jgi:hypothetical protein
MLKDNKLCVSLHLHLSLRRDMKKITFLIILLFSSLTLMAQQQLSEDAEISVLVCGPSHDAAFTLYGHAALRVNDPSQKIDIIFNYGIFDFTAPNFIYRFAKGETDYKLGIANFLDYIFEYQMRGSLVMEQVLNLTHQEKNAIWTALLINYQPENRVYRYNFFFDNCSSRLADIIEQNTSGDVVYSTSEQDPQYTFRDIINHCTRDHKWLTFGCDLALGSPTDRIATPHEMMFIPEFLASAFDKAVIQRADGSVVPLIKETIILSEFDPEENYPTKEVITPLLSAIVLLLTILAITYAGWRKNKYSRFLDITLFFIAGIGGCVLFFLAFVSVHPAVSPNWSLMWLHPLHLLGVVFFAVKKLNKVANCYHFINFVALAFFVFGWSFIPQQMNVAFIPLALVLFIRSTYAVYRVLKTNK